MSRVLERRLEHVLDIVLSDWLQTARIGTAVHCAVWWNIAVLCGVVNWRVLDLCAVVFPAVIGTLTQVTLQ